MKRSGSNRTLFLAMIVAAAAAVAAYLVMGNLNNDEEAPLAAVPAPTKVPTTGVLVVKQDIAASTVLTEEMLEVKQVALDVKNERALTKPEEAVGKTSSVALMRGEQVLNSRLEAQPQPGETFVKDLPPGKRAISISSDEVRGLGGLVQPGDHVDVLGFFVIDVKVIDGELAGVAPSGEESSSDEGSGDTESDMEDLSLDELLDGVIPDEDYEQTFSTYIVQNAEVLAVSQALTPEQHGVQEAAVPTPVPTPGAEDGTAAETAEDPYDPKARPSQKSVTLAVTPEEAHSCMPPMRSNIRRRLSGTRSCT